MFCPKYFVPNPRPLLRGIAALITAILMGVTELQAAVIINEINYEPTDKTELTEFIELYNAGAEAVNLGGWRIQGGIEFSFPSEMILGPESFLVVSQNPAQMAAIYAVDSLGPYTKKLANEGDAVVVCNADGDIVDHVEYGFGFPWPIASGGGGSSMELIHPWLDNAHPGSWRASVDAEGIAPLEPERWGGPATGTPGRPNSVLAGNAPPKIREVRHQPQQPRSNEATWVTARIADEDGIGAVKLEYQVVAPGDYQPAYLPLPITDLLEHPEMPLPRNPEFEDSNQWRSIEMRDNGPIEDGFTGEREYAVLIPAHAHRSLIRYRISAWDESQASHSIRVPYADDPSLNFAYFIYDAIPDYVAGDGPEDASRVYSAEVMNSLPVYHLISREQDVMYSHAYGAYAPWKIPVDLPDSRGKYNWEGAMVYNGVVYDHVLYRLRQANGRYQPGKRALRIRFNRGRFFKALDVDGKPYLKPWQHLNLGKLICSRGVFHFGLVNYVNSFLWNLVNVPAPRVHWIQLRVIDHVEECSETDSSVELYKGDFWGMYSVVEDYDSNFMDEHALPDGNLYRLKDKVLDGNRQKRNQGLQAVTDDSDYQNIRNNLRPERPDEWLVAHVNYGEWYRYHTVCEAVRHYDYHPADSHNKNQAWFFEPSPVNPLGRLWLLPWDFDTSWGPSYGYGIDYPKQAIFDQGGKPEFKVEYRNFIREFRDLVWREEVINPIIDRAAAYIEAFAPADLDRWGISQDHLPHKVQDMKNFGFVSWNGNYGDYVPVGGRAIELDEMANGDGDGSQIPETPAIVYNGPEGFPGDHLRFSCSAFLDPQGNHTFGGSQWRLAEVGGPNFPGMEDEGAPLVFEWNAVWSHESTHDYLSEMQLPANLVVPGRAYRVRVKFKDDSGRWSHWSSPVEFVAGDSDNWRRLRQDLRIMEIMYHPRESGAGEYIRLFNAGNSILDLATLRFVEGIRFEFNEGVSWPLAPGESAYLVEDRANILEWFPANPHRILGEYEGQLANEGETLRLTTVSDMDILNFGYDDDWFPATDGLGYSLVLKDPYEGSLDLNLAGSWEAETVSNGSLGRYINRPDDFPRGRLIINEFMYHPRDAGDLEFVELHNIGDSTITLSGEAGLGVRWGMGGGIAFHFNEPLSIPTGGYMVIVKINPDLFRQIYAIPGPVPVVGPYEGSLGNGGDTLVVWNFLEDESEARTNRVDEVHYLDQLPWPVEADGKGRSVSRRRWDAPSHDARSWVALPPTPGGGNWVDQDNDRMPDAWELEYGLDAEADDHLLDEDGDGINNLEEYISGTHPLEVDSRTAIYMGMAQGRGYIELSTKAAAQGMRYYQIQKRDNMVAEWGPFSEPLQGNDHKYRQYFEPEADRKAQYYRIRIWIEY